MNKKIVIIGSGISGLSSAALLAARGFDVTVVDKHDQPGGVARQRIINGYTFDTGPTWYLMPGVFEHFFGLFGKKPEDYYQLVDLDPSYRVFYSNGDRADITRDREKTLKLFEHYEPGSGKRLEKYLDAARYKHDTALGEFLYREYRTVFDFFNRKLMLEGTRMHIFKSLEKYTSRFFSSPFLKKILHFNVVFIGCSPYDSPALYSLMSHVDLVEGVRYPMGGTHSFIKGLYRLAQEQGVTFHFNQQVTKINVKNGKTTGVTAGDNFFPGDIVLSSADYHHTESQLLDVEYANYSSRYWKKRSMAPGALILLLGSDQKIPAYAHHNLYLSNSWEEHFSSIFRKRSWPEDPSYYVGCPSASDPSVAPEGKENMFVLVPVAPGLDDTDENRERLAQWTINHMEQTTGTPFSRSLEVREIISHRDFTSAYHSFQGTALGLAHTLFQTAVFRPSHRNKKIPNLYYTGHYTHPGIGMPMVMISSQVIADIIAGENR